MVTILQRGFILVGTNDPKGLFKVISLLGFLISSSKTQRCFAIAEREKEAKWILKNPHKSILAEDGLRLTIPPPLFFLIIYVHVTTSWGGGGVM